MKAYILEVAIATHSIIIGFDYGVLDSKEDLSDLKILFIAFVFHQVCRNVSLCDILLNVLSNIASNICVY